MIWKAWLLIWAAAVGVLEAAPPLRVGMELGYPPFEMVGPGGEPEGISVELARALAERLGRPLVIENTAFDGLIPALRTGKIDLIISSMTATDERRRAIDFSEPYVRIGLALLLRKGELARTPDELNQPGKRVAVKRGTTGHLFAMDQLPRAQLLVLDKENSAVLEVAQGRADAFIYDQLSVYANWKRNPETTQAALEPLQIEFWAIGVAKGQGELLEAVNAFLRDFRASGGFRQLAEKYFPGEQEAFRQLGVEFIF